MTRRSVYGLYIDGECVDTCHADNTDEAADWFADTWDINGDNVEIEEMVDE